MVELFHLEGSKEAEVLDSRTDKLIMEFDDGFADPKGLPLQRDHEHAIVLTEGTEPIVCIPIGTHTYKRMRLSDW